MSPPRQRDLSRADTVVEVMKDWRADYTAATGGRHQRRRSGFSASGSSADYHIRNESHFLRIREYARELDRNDLTVGQGIDRLCDNVVGGGFGLDVKTGDKGADRELRLRWEDWSQSPQACHSRGQLTWGAIERLALRHIVVDGDVLFLPLDDGTIEPVEAHRMRSPFRTARRIVHGVQLDERDRPTTYWLTKEEHGITEQLRVSDLEPFPAADAEGRRAVLHLFNSRRFSQTRGVTQLAPVIDAAAMHDDLQFAQLVAAQIQSCFAILRERDTMPILGGEDTGQAGPISTETMLDGASRTVEGVAPGMEVTGRPGEKLKGFTPTVPGAAFQDHATLVLTFVAINLGIPVAVLLLDPSNTNFSGWRGALEQAKKGFERVQAALRSQLHRSVYRWKVDQWIDDDPALRVVAQRGRADIYAHDWNPPTWPYIEPAKDAQADRSRLAGHLTSPRRLHAERGRRWEAVADEIIEDNAYLVEAAKKRAAKINEQYPDAPIYWRDLLDLAKAVAPPAAAPAGERR